MAGRSLSDIATEWLALWNGNLDQLSSIVAETVVTHAVLPGSTSLDALHGRDVLKSWIRQTHEIFSEHTTYEMRPIIQDPFLVVRWHSTGFYRGGMPEIAHEAVGRPIDFRGIDILRVENGLVAEFWISADTPVLMHQLNRSASGLGPSRRQTTSR